MGSSKLPLEREKGDFQPAGAELEASRRMPASAFLTVFGPEARADVGIRPCGSFFCFFNRAKPFISIFGGLRDDKGILMCQQRAIKKRKIVLDFLSNL